MINTDGDCFGQWKTDEHNHIRYNYRRLGASNYGEAARERDPGRMFDV